MKHSIQKNQMMLCGTAAEIKQAINGIAKSYDRHMTVKQYLANRPTMHITLGKPKKTKSFKR